MLFSDLLMCDPSVTLALDYKIQYVRCFKVSFGVEGRHGGGGEYKLLSQHQSSLLTYAKFSSWRMPLHRHPNFMSAYRRSTPIQHPFSIVS